MPTNLHIARTSSRAPLEASRQGDARPRGAGASGWAPSGRRRSQEEKADFFAHLEDILDVYARPVDPARPLVCVDERNVAFPREPGSSRPAAGESSAPPDTPDSRGVACFLAVAPYLGWRHVAISEGRAGVGWARAMRAVVDERFPDAERIVLVLDHRPIHHPASFYKAFPPAEAKRILDKLELHVTPTWGRWLNMAEMEVGALARQRLARRLPDRATLATEIAAWTEARNAARITLEWRFTIADARASLARLYPVIPPER